TVPSPASAEVTDVTFPARCLAGFMAVAVVASVGWPQVGSSSLPTPPPKSRRSVRTVPGDNHRILEKPDSLTLLSLDPMPVGFDYEDGHDSLRSKRRLKPGTVPGPDGCLKVLGQVLITSRREQRRVLAALRESIANGRHPAACFSPRHALRATRADRTVYVVM